jgi:signal transduction histidine kinase
LRLATVDGMAVITVADNGCGMAPETAARIWEPFFSTKGEEGTGLGLDVAKSIIEAHGGTIECVSAPQQGATFTIRLPLYQAAETGAPPSSGVLTTLATSAPTLETIQSIS